MVAVAVQFDGFIRALLTTRRGAGTAAPKDLTMRLLREQVGDRDLTVGELASLLRNWTVGELSTIAVSVGILAHYLAAPPETRQLLRNDFTLIGEANDEILQIQAPMIANRRVMLAHTDTLTSAPGEEPIRARYPGGGFDSVSLILT